MEAYVMRIWLPDRPGALGQVASRIGAVRGDVVAIDILERDGGQAIDELVVELPRPGLVDLLVTEVREVDGVAVEEVRPLGDAPHDPRFEAVETVARLVRAGTVDGLLAAVVEHAGKVVGAAWVAVVDTDAGRGTLAAAGSAPSARWLESFVAGSRAADGPLAGPVDVMWAPLSSGGLALVMGRESLPFRARERRLACTLARVVDTRLRELARERSRARHPGH